MFGTGHENCTPNPELVKKLKKVNFEAIQQKEESKMVSLKELSLLAKDLNTRDTERYNRLTKEERQKEDKTVQDVTMSLDNNLKRVAYEEGKTRYCAYSVSNFDENNIRQPFNYSGDKKNLDQYLIGAIKRIYDFCCENKLTPKIEYDYGTGGERSNINVVIDWSTIPTSRNGNF
jgi:hypothetical protein